MHGKENANVIGEGGAVGLTENPSALRRWMVAGPELSRMIQEFEGSNNQTEENDYHEKSGIHIWDIMDNTVVKTVRSVTKIGEKLSNLFANERFVERRNPDTQPFKKNNIPTFTSTKKETVKDESGSFKG